MNSDSFVLSLLNEKVKLSAKYMNKHFKTHILNILIGKNEGKCSKHGYIKKHSIELKRVSIGNVEIQSLRGFVNYDVQFTALVCNPTKGSVLKSKVINSNNFGVLCVCGIQQGSEYTPIIDIIVPKNSLHIQSNANIDINALKKDDIINVEIVGKKFEINDPKISAVGKIVDVKVAPKLDVENNEIDNNKFEVDDDAYEDDLSDDEVKYKGNQANNDDDNDNDNDNDTDTEVNELDNDAESEDDQEDNSEGEVLSEDEDK